MLDLREISYRFDYSPLFKGLSTSVAPGQILHVCGSNGTGKTTLLKILAGIKPASQGEVSYQGLTLSDDLSNYQQNVLYLGHQSLLCDYLTVRENCRLNLMTPASYEAIDSAIDQLKLANYADSQVSQLSAGQKRRVILTQLYLSKKSLWLLDEPFTALDKETIAQICQQLILHCQQGGMIIMTSHQALTITEVAVKQLDISCH